MTEVIEKKLRNINDPNIYLRRISSFIPRQLFVTRALQEGKLFS